MMGEEHSEAVLCSRCTVLAPHASLPPTSTASVSIDHALMMPPALESHVLAGRTMSRSNGDICVESVATASFNGALMHSMHVVHARGTREAHALSKGVKEIDLFHRV